MTFLSRILLALAVLGVPHVALAQASQAFFDNYLELRARLDTLMKNRDIAEVMPVFGDQSEPADLEDLEQRVRSIYPQDFENVALIRRQDLDHGFRQEMIAYWTGVNYIYVYITLHERDDGIVAMGFSFNSDFDEINAKF